MGGRKKERIVHSPFSRKKRKTDFIHSYVRNCIMFLKISRERRRCFTCGISKDVESRRAEKKNVNDATYSRRRRR